MTIKKNAVRKSTLTQKAQLMSGSEIERTLVRLAHEILKKTVASKAWAWSESAVVECPSQSVSAR